jgi:uncharacterized RDD family membrane protein YckC
VVTLVDKKPARMPPTPADQDLLEYELPDLAAERREALSFWLVMSEIPYEWTPDGVLVVPSKWELEVDSILDSLPRDAPAHPDPVHVENFAGSLPVAAATTIVDELASPGRRLAAWFIDFLVLLVPAAIADVVVGPKSGAARVTLLAIDAAYVIGGIAIWGRTIGKVVARIEVVRRDGIAPPGFGVAFMRWLVPVASYPLTYLGSAGPLLSFVWVVAVYAPILGPARRGLHDRAAGTDVVRTA